MCKKGYFFILFSLILLFFHSLAFCDITQKLWYKKYLGTIYIIKVSDLDNDGKKEIVVGSSSGLSVFDENGNILWQNNKITDIYRIELIDVDNDGKKEILGSTYLEFFISDYNGEHFYIENPTTFSVRPVPFTVTDEDNDGVKEIYFGYDSLYKYQFINKTFWYKKFYQLPELNSGMQNEISIIVSGDINGDNIPDIVVKLGDGIYQLVNDSFKKITSDALKNITVGNIVLFDTNNDGKEEIIVSGVISKDLFVIDNTGKLLWKFSGDELIKQLYFIDINNDGKKEILINANNSSLSNDATNNILYALNKEGKLLWKTVFPSTLSGTLKNVIKYSSEKLSFIIGKTLGFLDSKTGNILESSKTFQNTLNNIAILYSETLLVSGVNIYKININSNIDSMFYENGYVVSKIITGDVNGDGIDEIVALDSILYPQILHVYNYKGELLWQKFIKPNDVAIADINNDGKKEIIVAIQNSGVSVYDYKGNIIWKDDNLKFAEKIEVADINNDGKKEIIVGRWGGITVYDNGGNQIFTFNNLNNMGHISAIEVFDINNDGYKEIIFDSSYITILDKDGKRIVMGGSWNEKDTLRVTKIDNKIVIVTAIDNKLVVYDTSLNELDSYSNDNSITDIKIKDNFIYFTDKSKVVKLSYNNGNLIKVWTYQHEKFNYGYVEPLPVKLVFFNNYIVAAGYKLYFINENGSLYKLINPLGEGRLFAGGNFPGLNVANFYTDKKTLLFGLDGIYAFGEKGSLPETSKKEELVINSGWSLKALPTDTSVKIDFFNNIKTVWKWINKKWYIYSPDDNIKKIIAKYNIPVINEISSGEGFWINSAEEIIYEFNKIADYGVEKFLNNLSSGWNLVGVGKEINSNQFIDLFKNIITLWTWENSKWKIWSPNDNIIKLLEEYKIEKVEKLFKGEGFWINN